jgi:WD40 repeat protein
MLSLEGLATYMQTPELVGALRTLLSRWPQRTLILHDDYVTDAVFSRDPRVVLTSSADGLLRLVDVRGGAVVRHTRGWGVPISSAALRPDGKVAAAGYQDGCVRIFDFDGGESTEVRLSDAGIDHVAISPAGSKIFASAGAAPFMIDLANGRDYKLPGHSDSITSATFYADARVVTTSKDGRVRTFDLDAQQWEEFGLSEAAINTACVSPDGTWMAVSGSFNGVLLVDTKTRGMMRRLDVPGGSGLLMALSEDGERLAVSDIWGRVLVFNPRSGEVVANKKCFQRTRGHWL